MCNRLPFFGLWVRESAIDATVCNRLPFWDGVSDESAIDATVCNRLPFLGYGSEKSAIDATVCNRLPFLKYFLVEPDSLTEHLREPAPWSRILKTIKTHHF